MQWMNVDQMKLTHSLSKKSLQTLGAPFVHRPYQKKKKKNFLKCTHYRKVIPLPYV